MKVLYIGNGLTHYYNLVLSRLNDEPGVELVVVAPRGVGAGIGQGVYQTRDGINFRVIELVESTASRLHVTFEGLAGVLRTERPDAVIVVENYLRAFMFDLPVVLAMKAIRARLILKSIPFRYTTHDEALRRIEASPAYFASLPRAANVVLQRLGLARRAKRAVLGLTSRLLNLPDAYVNYVEAWEYWDGYRVPREKIFVTRNSPDTDLLFAARAAVEKGPPILPPNPHRLLHVGRLVQWKRVDMLIRAFARVRGRFPRAELLVIGTGPESESLRALAAELGLGSSVSFLGGVYDPELLSRYYLACSLYVLAGMGGLSINEAMCFALPIVCSVCDGTEKVLVRDGENGRYFADGSEDDLTAKLEWFLAHPAEAAAMGRRSEEIIRRDVNIRTVIDGYLDALRYVARTDRIRATLPPPR
jgi:glycosyltransferase involved in cell wall biosynthesis